MPPAAKMHADEVDVDAALVRRLLDAQIPEWAELPLSRAASSGTDNAIYRLGDEMAVRLPRHPGAVASIEKEACWLPRLASRLPLAVPETLVLGAPDDDYPWPWVVTRWVPGETGVEVADPAAAAVALAAFVGVLQKLDPAGGPVPGDHNFGRGAPLATRDGYFRAALAQMEDAVETDAVAAVWERALAAPVWDGPPVWIHGDLHGGNILVNGGRVAGVIDFGGLGVGDPACDLMPAWTFLTPEAREVFRTDLEVDDATWERGRGWVVSMGVIAFPYYRETNPPLAAMARRWIKETVDDR